MVIHRQATNPMKPGAKAAAWTPPAALWRPEAWFGGVSEVGPPPKDGDQLSFWVFPPSTDSGGSSSCMVTHLYIYIHIIYIYIYISIYYLFVYLLGVRRVNQHVSNHLGGNPRLTFEPLLNYIDET